MKKVSKFVLIAVFGLIVFFYWWSNHPIALVSNVPGVKVEASAIPDDSAHILKIKLKLINTDKVYSIKSMDLKKELAKSMMLTPPEGFVEKPLALEKSESNDSETVKFVEDFNKNNIKWSGNFVLNPNQETILRIPATAINNKDTGSISFIYEWSGKVLGGSISYFKVNINK